MNPELNWHERVARRAYEIYEREGCPPDRSGEHWLKAEQSLRDELFLTQEMEVEEFEGGLVPKT